MQGALSPLLVVLTLCGCAPRASAPPTREVVHLRGNAYERGLLHGTQLRSKVRHGDLETLVG